MVPKKMSFKWQRAMTMRKVLQEILEKNARFHHLTPLKTKHIAHWCRCHGYTPPDPESLRNDGDSIEDVLTQIDSEPGKPAGDSASWAGTGGSARSTLASHQLPWSGTPPMAAVSPGLEELLWRTGACSPPAMCPARAPCSTVPTELSVPESCTPAGMFWRRPYNRRALFVQESPSWHRFSLGDFASPPLFLQVEVTSPSFVTL